MIRFANESVDEFTVAPVDSSELKHKVVKLAEQGFWDIRLKTPENRRLTVRQLVKLYGLERLLAPATR